MAFIVKTVGGPARAEKHEHPGDWYEFIDGGVLAVHFGDDAKWSEYYPPHRWEQVTADQPTGPPPADPAEWAAAIY